MSEFNWFPTEFHPMKSEHVEYQCVFRATKSTEVPAIEDFLPWIIEHQHKIELFRPVVKPECKQHMFGVSLFTDLPSLKEKVRAVPDLNRKTRSYSKGFTSIIRGISTKEDNGHHVEYYLYDYENNSPCHDFDVIEVR